MDDLENQSESDPQKQAASGDSQGERIEAELQAKEREYKEMYDRYLRTVADFENYKKRAAREQVEFSRFSNEKLLKELLPVLDSLDRALGHAKEARDTSTLIEGMDLIQRQFLDVLSKFGVQALESEGKPFDPHFHQAVKQEEGESEGGEHFVVAEAQKGYRLHDRLLRPAMVVVSKRRENGSRGEESRLKGPEKSLKDDEGG